MSRWPWSRDYAKGARYVNYSWLGDSLDKFHFRTTFRDENYMALTDRNLLDFVWKWHNDRILKYGSNGKEFPDCDDFSLLCLADVVRGGILEGFSAMPAIGLLTYYRKEKGQRHMACVAINSMGAVRIYEPQWKHWLDPMQEVKDGELAAADI